MTEKNQGNTKQQGQRQQKKHWRKRNHPHSSDYKKKDKDPEEIPIVKYGPRQQLYQVYGSTLQDCPQGLRQLRKTH